MAEKETNIEKIEETDLISVEDLFEKDITYQDLPEAVKEYFQQILNKIPKRVTSYKSQIEIVQRLKNILMTGYLRDVIFDHVVKTKEKYKDMENPEEWIRQINPTLFTKFYQMRGAQSEEMLELFDTVGGDDFGKDEEISIRKIMLEKKIIRKKKPKDEIIIEADYELVEDDTKTG